MSIQRRADKAPLAPEELDALAEYYSAMEHDPPKPKTSGTKKAYSLWFSRFEQWASAQGIETVPAPPAAVAHFLSELAGEGLSASSLELCLSAISSAHRDAGHHWQRYEPSILAVIKKAKRAKPSAKKAPITEPELRAMLGSCDESIKGQRDRALLLVGFFTACRIGELAALKLSDITVREEGLAVMIRRSKTDQEGQGFTKALPVIAKRELCPVAALDAYLTAAGLGLGSEEPLFRSIDRHGNVGSKISGRSISALVKTKAEAADLDPKRFGGHSFRHGFVTAARAKGICPLKIMTQTGHRSVVGVLHYDQSPPRERLSVFDDNATLGMA